MQISVSQLANFIACPRKWWFSHVAKLTPIVEPEALRRGRTVHEYIGAWLSGKPLPDLGEYGNYGRAFTENFPLHVDRGEQELIETRVEVPTSNGHTLVGVIDYATYIDEAWHLYDWKTTKPKPFNVGKIDLQLLVYDVTLRELRAAKAVHRSHVFIYPDSGSTQFKRQSYEDSTYDKRKDAWGEIEAGAEMLARLHHGGPPPMLPGARSPSGGFRPAWPCGWCSYLTLCSHMWQYGQDDGYQAILAEDFIAEKEETRGEETEGL